MRLTRSGSIAAAVIVSLGVGACGGSSTTATSTTSSSAASSGTTAARSDTTAAPVATTAIHIMGFKFVPTPARAKVGDTITVTNEDNTDHSLTAIDGSFDTGVFSGGSKTIKLAKAGTFAIHCRIHNFMTGSIIVTP